MPLTEEVFKPSLSSIQPYKGGKGRLVDVGVELHKLSSNENPYGCSPLVKEAIGKAVSRLNEYPDQTDIRLRIALSEFYNQELSADQFITGNGGVNIIEIIVHSFLDTKTNCIVSNPCFLPYIQFSEKVGAKVIDVPLLDPDYRLDVSGIIGAINQDTRVLWLCSPNNPTGTYIRKEELEEILDVVPDHVVVVYDEVYFNYAVAEDYVTGLDYVMTGKNVIAINSFSKSYGMAGVRAGYAYTTEQIASYINGAKRPFYLNRLALAGAIAALQDQDFIKDTVQKTHEQRAFLCQQLEKLQIGFWPTQANFVLIDPKMHSAEFESMMAIRGVMVRPADAFGAPNKIRVTIGTAANNQAFVEACKQVMRS